MIRFKRNFRSSSWEDIHAAFKDDGITNILNLLDLVHSLPPTSVLNESGFNQLKLIKTDRRHSLNEQHLNDLMLIKLQSPPVSEFDPNPAIDRWLVGFKSGLNETKIGKKLITVILLFLFKPLFQISPGRSKRRFDYKRAKKITTCTSNVNDVEMDCTFTSDNECADESDIEKEGERVVLGDEDRNSDEESDEECEQELYENERMIEEVVREMEMEMEMC